MGFIILGVFFIQLWDDRALSLDSQTIRLGDINGQPERGTFKLIQHTGLLANACDSQNHKSKTP